jgi:hypothetical protein
VEAEVERRDERSNDSGGLLVGVTNECEECVPRLVS